MDYLGESLKVRSALRPNACMQSCTYLGIWSEEFRSLPIYFGRGRPFAVTWDYRPRLVIHARTSAFIVWPTILHTLGNHSASNASQFFRNQSVLLSSAAAHQAWLPYSDIGSNVRSVFGLVTSQPCMHACTLIGVDSGRGQDRITRNSVAAAS